MAGGRGIFTSPAELSDVRFVKLIRQVGYEGYGIVCSLRLLMWDAAGNELDYAGLECYAELLRANFDKFKAIIDVAIDIGIFAKKKGVFYCPEITEQFEKYLSQVKGIKSKKKGRTQGRTQGETVGDTPQGSIGSIGSDLKGEIQEGGKVRYPTEASPVFLAPDEIEELSSAWGQDEFDYLVSQLIDYSTTQAKKFNAYKDHKRVLTTWRDLKHGKGTIYYRHPRDGPGYYRAYDVDRWTREMN